MRFLAVLIVVSFSLLAGCASIATPGPVPSSPSPSDVADSYPGIPSEANISDKVSFIANILAVIAVAAVFIRSAIYLARKAYRDGLDSFDIARIVVLVGLFAAAVFFATRL